MTEFLTDEELDAIAASEEERGFAYEFGHAKLDRLIAQARAANRMREELRKERTRIEQLKTEAHEQITETLSELAALLETAEDMCEELWGWKYGKAWDAAFERARKALGR